MERRECGEMKRRTEARDRQPPHSSLPKRSFGTHFFRNVDELPTIERITP